MAGVNKIISNTIILYSRTILAVLLNLYSTRIVMEMLGVSDYGLYYVIGGVIAMLSVVNNAMTVSTQRNISISLGRNDLYGIKKVIGNTISLHLAIGAVLLLLFEVLGLYYVNYKLVFDREKVFSANVIFQFVVISSFVGIISVPYDAILNATEQMRSVAIIGVMEALLKVVVAWSLGLFSNNKLIVFGLLTMISALIVRFVKWNIVRSTFRNYLPERYIWNNSEIKNLGCFAGWNLFGSFSYMARTQGLSLVLNLFFGTVINAAFGIANQISLQVTFVCSALMQAIVPQIMKSEGSNNRSRMLKLAFCTSKISFLLVSVVAIPLMFEMPFILSWWLKTVPEYAVFISILFLVAVLLNQLTAGLDSAIHATGEIKKYMLFNGISKVLILPMAYILLKTGQDLRFVFFVYAFFEAFGSGIRLLILKRVCQINIRDYLFSNFFPLLISTALICAVLKFFTMTVHFEYRWLLTLLISVLLFPIIAWILVLNDIEKKQVQGALNLLLFKLSGKRIIFKS